MWELKTFKTQAAQNNWIAKNEHKYQIVVIYLNNEYGVEYRKLRKLY